jgi:hypothetical protein
VHCFHESGSIVSEVKMSRIVFYGDLNTYSPYTMAIQLGDICRVSSRSFILGGKLMDYMAVKSCRQGEGDVPLLCGVRRPNILGLLKYTTKYMYWGSQVHPCAS